MFIENKFLKSFVHGKMAHEIIWHKLFCIMNNAFVQIVRVILSCTKIIFYHSFDILFFYTILQIPFIDDGFCPSKILFQKYLQILFCLLKMHCCSEIFTLMHKEIFTLYAQGKLDFLQRKIIEKRKLFSKLYYDIMKNCNSNNRKKKK